MQYTLCSLRQWAADDGAGGTALEDKGAQKVARCGVCLFGGINSMAIYMYWASFCMPNVSFTVDVGTACGAM